MSKNKIKVTKREIEREKKRKKELKMKIKKQRADEKKTVLSIDFGKGRVTGIFKLYDGVDDYIGVEFISNQVTNYYPVKDCNEFRYLSSQIDLELALDSLKVKSSLKKFKEKKDRTDYFKAEFTSLNILSIARTIADLSRVTDHGALEKKMLQKNLESFALEVSLVLKTSLDEAMKMISNNIKEI